MNLSRPRTTDPNQRIGTSAQAGRQFLRTVGVAEELLRPDRVVNYRATGSLVQHLEAPHGVQRHLQDAGHFYRHPRPSSVKNEALHGAPGEEGLDGRRTANSQRRRDVWRAHHLGWGRRYTATWKGPCRVSEMKVKKNVTISGEQTDSGRENNGYCWRTQGGLFRGAAFGTILDAAVGFPGGAATDSNTSGGLGFIPETRPSSGRGASWFHKASAAAT